jgi:cyclic beta-1,2-glucan synthetase
MAFAALGQGDKAAGLFWLLNPINRSRTYNEAQRYRVEPYAVAADVYSAPPHVGRGGWTWYTGAAGWLYRAGLESILGLHVEGAELRLKPCIPPAWPGFEIRYQFGRSTYEIFVKNPSHVSSGIAQIQVDVQTIIDPSLPVTLVDDGLPHSINVVLG